MLDDPCSFTGTSMRFHPSCHSRDINANNNHREQTHRYAPACQSTTNEPSPRRQATHQPVCCSQRRGQCAAHAAVAGRVEPAWLFCHCRAAGAGQTVKTLLISRLWLGLQVPRREPTHWDHRFVYQENANAGLFITSEQHEPCGIASRFSLSAMRHLEVARQRPTVADGPAQGRSSTRCASTNATKRAPSFVTRGRHAPGSPRLPSGRREAWSLAESSVAQPCRRAAGDDTQRCNRPRQPGSRTAPQPANLSLDTSTRRLSTTGFTFGTWCWSGACWAHRITASFPAAPAARRPWEYVSATRLGPERLRLPAAPGLLRPARLAHR